MTSPTVVEYCLGNVDPSVRAQLRDLEARTLAKPCLQRCGECFAGDFLVVDGELVTAESHASVLADLE